MTRIFTEEGVSIPVTVIEVIPNCVTQVKNFENDGYRAIQITTGTRHLHRISKPLAGHFAKAGVQPGRGLWEFPLAEGEGEDYTVGYEFKAGIFQAGQKVDASGVSIGKGYAGTVKRHHFSTQDATHGNSLSHRAVGSIGQNQYPSKVFKGKRMPGHLGNARRTTQNLEVIRVDEERNLLLLKGAVPGARGSDVMIRPAVKTKSKEA
jgi:large subunit ribosomal protein L3